MQLDEKRETRTECAGLVLEMPTVEPSSLIDPARVDGGAERLVVLESVISDGLQVYIAVGDALEEIRGCKLYRELGFKTFDRYCIERWNMSARTAYQRISAASVPENVKTFSQPPNFSQAVELAALSPEQQGEVAKTISLAGSSLNDVPVRELREIARDIKTGMSPAEAVQASIEGSVITVPHSEKKESVPAPPSASVSHEGDVWLLRNHRLLVGDATSSADIAALMAGESADLGIADPPYNVDYEGRTKERLTIKNDKMSEDELKVFLEKTFCGHASVLKPSASFYVFHASWWQREVQNALEAAGFQIRNQIIWGKNHFGGGFGRYRFQHEPIFYCHFTGETDDWYGDRAQSTLWQVKRPAANRLHPTMKPVELIERALFNSSKTGDIVIDLFGGSGTTLIVCERHGRQARLMEIDPRYADVIVRRWQAETAEGAILDGDGRTFDHIAQERSRIAA